MKKKIYLFTIFGLLFLTSCQENQTPAVVSELLETSNDVERVEPPNWWIGFENPQLQLLVNR